MKKLIIFCVFISFLFANNIKDNKWFVNVNGGKLKIHSYSSVVGVKIGYYFYDPNIYKINNRIYVDVAKVDSNADFYITSLKLDWIKNNLGFIAPFVGVNVGYLYFKQNNNDYSAGVWGGEAGFLFNITEHFSLEIEACYQKAYEKTNIWNTPLKTLKAGLEVSF